MVQIREIEESQQAHMCSNFKKIYVTYEYYDKTLENVVDDLLNEKSEL